MILIAMFELNYFIDNPENIKYDKFLIINQGCLVLLNAQNYYHWRELQLLVIA